jgi:hypothetical protein
VIAFIRMTRSERRDATTAPCITSNRLVSSDKSLVKPFAASMAADMSSLLLVSGDGTVIVRIPVASSLSTFAECENIPRHAARTLKHRSGLASGHCKQEKRLLVNKLKLHAQLEVKERVITWCFFRVRTYEARASIEEAHWRQRVPRFWYWLQGCRQRKFP